MLVWAALEGEIAQLRAGAVLRYCVSQKQEGCYETVLLTLVAKIAMDSV